MRELGFSVMWLKLNQEQYTTFRFPRKDKDWEVGEIVRVVFHPRSKDRKVLGTAQIMGKQPRTLAPYSPAPVTPEEALEDGFESLMIMRNWMRKRYGNLKACNPMNKLTILWVSRDTYCFQCGVRTHGMKFCEKHSQVALEDDCAPD